MKVIKNGVAPPYLNNCTELMFLVIMVCITLLSIVFPLRIQDISLVC